MFLTITWHINLGWYATTFSAKWPWPSKFMWNAVDCTQMTVSQIAFANCSGIQGCIPRKTKSITFFTFTC